jgi:hypothetical protein
VINARAELNQVVASTWRSDRCFLYEDKGETDFAPDCLEAAPAAEPLVVVWGDSTAAAFFTGLRQLQPQLHVRLGQLTAARCPALLSAAVKASGSPWEARCRAINDRALAEIRRAHPAVVVLAGGWYGQPPLTSGLPYTIEQLQAQGVKVVLVGSPPHWDSPLPKRVLTAFRATSKWPERLPLDLTKVQQVDNLVADIARRYGVDFVSPTQALCDAEGCLTRVGDPPSLLTYDQIHLTPQGARLVALAVAPAIRAGLASP